MKVAPEVSQKLMSGRYHGDESEKDINEEKNMYELEKTDLPGVVILAPKTFSDERGVLFEIFRTKENMGKLR